MIFARILRRVFCLSGCPMHSIIGRRRFFFRRLRIRKMAWGSLRFTVLRLRWGFLLRSFAVRRIALLPGSRVFLSRITRRIRVNRVLFIPGMCWMTTGSGRFGQRPRGPMIRFFLRRGSVTMSRMVPGRLCSIRRKIWARWRRGAVPKPLCAGTTAGWWMRFGLVMRRLSACRSMFRKVPRLVLRLVPFFPRFVRWRVRIWGAMRLCVWWHTIPIFFSNSTIIWVLPRRSGNRGIPGLFFRVSPGAVFMRRWLSVRIFPMCNLLCGWLLAVLLRMMLRRL